MGENILMMHDDVDGATFIESRPNISLTASSDEMLRITPDGFYVRGIKIDQDENEAEKVYKAFHAWLTWATINRTY